MQVSDQRHYHRNDQGNSGYRRAALEGEITEAAEEQRVRTSDDVVGDAEGDGGLLRRGAQRRCLFVGVGCEAAMRLLQRERTRFCDIEPGLRNRRTLEGGCRTGIVPDWTPPPKSSRYR